MVPAEIVDCTRRSGVGGVSVRQSRVIVAVVPPGIARAGAGILLAPLRYTARPMRTLLARLAREETGQDFAEYGIALAIMTGTAVLIAVAIGQDVQNLWQTGQSAVVQATANP